MRFRMKITLAMLLVITVVYSVGSAIIIARFHESGLQREKDAAAGAYRTAAVAMGLVNGVDSERSLGNVSKALRSLAGEFGWDYVILSQEGKTLFEYGDREVQLPAFEKNGHVLTVFASGEEQYILVNGVLDTNANRLELATVTNISEIYRARIALQGTCRRVFLIMFAVCGILAWVISYWLTRPLSKMSAAARKIAGGDLSARVKASSNDEMGSLARDFSNMADKLEESMNTMRGEMERQENFMGSFAHELKTPMTSIIGYADLIRTQALDENETMEAANYIFSEGKRLESLSLKLLELLVVKNGEPDMENADMEQLIVSVVNRLRPIYREYGIALQCRTAPGTWTVDVDLIKSLLINLVDNARKAVEKNGNIFIFLDWPDGLCRIRILDNGRGMPPEVLSRLTEAFYRVDKARSRAQGGAGLGLSLCREIALLHRGKLEFDSRIDNGTCVTVILGGGIE